MEMNEISKAKKCIQSTDLKLKWRSSANLAFMTDNIGTKSLFSSWYDKILLLSK